jgi:hypothetical protein
MQIRSGPHSRAGLAARVARSLSQRLRSVPAAACAVFLLVLAAKTAIHPGALQAADETQPPIDATAGRETDRIEVKWHTAAQPTAGAVIEIRSPSGISHAVLRREPPQWPARVYIRLYLKGLEHLRITSDRAEPLEAALSSQDVGDASRQWKNRDESALLDPHSPWWLRIRRLEGCVEIQLPRALLEANPESLTVHWIDFYRN